MKRILSALLVLFLCFTPLVSAALPANSIIVGNKIYDVEYVKTHTDEVNQEIIKNAGYIYFIDNEGKIVNMESGNVISEDQLSKVLGSKLTYYDSSGNVKVYISDSTGIYKDVANEDVTSYGYAVADITISSSLTSEYKVISVRVKDIKGVKNAYSFAVNNEANIRKLTESYTYISPLNLNENLNMTIYLFTAAGLELGSGSVTIPKDKLASQTYFSIPFTVTLKSYSSTGFLGNTPGNLSNAGLAVQDDDFIYYSNLADGGKIYKKSITGIDEYPLVEDNAKYLNIQDDYIYYSNYSDGGKIYRVKTDGTGRQRLNNDMSSYINVVGDDIYYINNSDKAKICRLRLGAKQVITSDSASFLTVFGNYIYYVNNSDKGRLYRIDVNGKNKTALSRVGARYINLLSDGTLFFSGTDGKLYKYSIQSGNLSEIPITSYIPQKGGNSTKPVRDKISVVNVYSLNEIYYKSYYDGGRLYKADMYGYGTRVVEDSIGYINIAGDSIYYTKGNRLYRIPMNNSNNQKPEAVAKIKFDDKVVLIDPLPVLNVSDPSGIVLPDKVSAIMSDNTIRELLVNWDLNKVSVKNGIYQYKGKIVGYGNSVSFAAALNSESINPKNIYVENSTDKGQDFIRVTGLKSGDIVYLYDPQNMTKALTKATADKNGIATIKFELNSNGGTLALTVKRANRAESRATVINYPSEAPIIVSVGYNEADKKFEVVYKGNSSNIKFGFAPYLTISLDNKELDSRISWNEATADQVEGETNLYKFTVSYDDFMGVIGKVNANDTVARLYVKYQDGTSLSKPAYLYKQDMPLNLAFDVNSRRILGTDAVMEYTYDPNTDSWRMCSAPYTDVATSGKVGVYVRYKAYANKLPSKYTFVPFVENPIIVTATNNGNTISEGSVVEGVVNISVALNNNLPSSAKISSVKVDGIIKSNYNNIAISEEGLHTVYVEATVEGAKITKEFKFTIDNSEIPSANIKIATPWGDTGLQKYYEAKVTWDGFDSNKFTRSAVIIKDGGIPIPYFMGMNVVEYIKSATNITDDRKLNGTYKIKVTTTKKSTGKSKTEEIEFEIDRTLPSFEAYANSDTLDTNTEYVASNSINLTWNDDNEVKAFISRNGGQEVEITNGSVINLPGSYRLRFIVKRKENGAVVEKVYRINLSY
ncbi:Ig-like domain (group 4) [Caloramator fervidus]|uniref:Ig-like domain (Group 4) n=1 Tax=Caloramator fervidus TaxID=29344 RepID=A0A1H5RJP3_9CLOT|nr:DUF5050 domain-containing protein [Caloramator fervidus]SEF38583.1 Ig-like domain (group 4) [Caloramator fervidus]